MPRVRWQRLLVALVPYGLLVLVGLASAVAVDAWLGPARAQVTLGVPRALWLLGGTLLVVWTGFHLHVRRTPSFSFSRVGDLAQTRRGVVAWLSPLPRALRAVVLALLAVALARPQTFAREEIDVEGIDLLIVLDLSRSMEERDLRPNRMDAAQRTVRAFLQGRKNDRIGLVVFAKQAMLRCPLTSDYGVLDSIVADLQIGDVDPMGTAIGDAVGLAVGSLRRADARSKIVVLLTDGDSNVATEMTPEDAIRAAKDKNVRIFTVLMGRESGRLEPRGRPGYAVNPELLQRMATETDGRYFHAGDTAALERGFAEVRETLEKTKRREIRRVPDEHYGKLAAVAGILLLLEIVLSLTRFRRFP